MNRFRQLAIIILGFTATGIIIRMVRNGQPWTEILLALVLTSTLILLTLSIIWGLRRSLTERPLKQLTTTFLLLAIASYAISGWYRLNNEPWLSASLDGIGAAFLLLAAYTGLKLKQGTDAIPE